ncbi:MAG: class I SAM-dependent methyltransferase [Bacteroidetes bacterium]|nr:MAG: class I SAM-dependent methyltransferase [Bacteroidota bacterium]
MPALPELEDQPWFPQTLRRQQMDFIGFTVSVFGVYKPIVPVLTALLQSTEQHHITDLCSGAGGPASYLRRRLPNAEFLLTDLYPQNDIPLEPGMHYCQAPYNVLTAPLPKAGIATMFNAFHHFSPSQQEAWLQKVAQSKCPLLVVEVLSPTLASFMTILVTTTIGQLLLAPFVKPFSILRLLLTYVLPINLFTIAWDGLASVLKSVPTHRWQTLSQGCSTTSYQFTCYRLGTLFSPLYVLKGIPTA